MDGFIPKPQTADRRPLLTYYFSIAVFLAIAIMSNFTDAQGQNLVPNPSFEDHPAAVYPTPTSTPNNKRGSHWITRLLAADPDNVNDWFRGNQATPDYYHVNAGLPIDWPADDGVLVPQNWGQIQDLNAPTGNAYAGIWIRRVSTNPVHPIGGTEDWHEYLCAKLNAPLVSGKKYVIRFKYAIANFEDEDQKPKGPDGLKSGYYLKNLGVKFAPNTNFKNYDVSKQWWSATTGQYTEALAMNTSPGVEVSNLGYAEPGTWQTFESTYQCSDNNLEYMVLGNFQYRIPLAAIGKTSEKFTPDLREIIEDQSYSFYFYIDDVEVRELETGGCDCQSIFVCPHTRNVTLQTDHPNS